jgi:hypothetical protein
MKKLLISPLALGGLIAALVISLGALMVAQIVTENSPKGFVLPEGTAVKGKLAFVELGCVQCHSVYGVEFNILPTMRATPEIQLGGARPRAMSYGMLTTAIIHPNQSIRGKSDAYVDSAGRSLMADLNQSMTVAQMADLVAFLLDHYEVEIPAYYDGYRMGYPTGYKPTP